jgi:hypothetical protein
LLGDEFTLLLEFAGGLLIETVGQRPLLETYAVQLGFLGIAIAAFRRLFSLQSVATGMLPSTVASTF